jgi:hypothetical protein
VEFITDNWFSVKVSYPKSYPNDASDSSGQSWTPWAKKNRQVVDLLGGFEISTDILGCHETFKWWSRGESNPRPQAITGQFYMRSCLI